MAHDRAFGDLQFEELRRQARPFQRLARGFLDSAALNSTPETLTDSTPGIETCG
jgi:hypothetical protein